MTGRDDELTADQQSWLQQQNFRVLLLSGLTDAQMQDFVQNVADQLTLDVTEAAARNLIRLALGNPEVARQTLLKAADAGITAVDEAFVDRHGRSTVRELWAQTRQDIEARLPAAGYVLDALGVFDAARVGPRRDMVLAYAAHLWRRSRWALFGLQRSRALTRALAALAPYEIRVEDDLIQYLDQVVSEMPDVEFSRQALARFLKDYRWWSQNRWLRRLNRLFVPNFLALADLAIGYAYEKQYRPAIDAYTAAIRVAPYFGLYNNRGNARKALGDLTGALADYNRAIALNPQYATAYLNRALVREAQGDLKGAQADYDQAIALNPQDATAYLSRSLVRKAQGDLEGAQADYDQATMLPADGLERAVAYNN
jgi:tetratricopeptide (TPR) repeat protein